MTAPAPPLRRQLSLFVEGASLPAIETLRTRLDPVQHALIPAHVTLCRDDEVRALTTDAVRERLAGAAAIGLRFGPPQRFDGHGVRLPCTGGASAFEALRARALGRAAERQAVAHITLAHPRNPRAAGNGPSAPIELATPLNLRFASVRLIEQAPPAPWRVIETFALAAG